MPLQHFCIVGLTSVLVMLAKSIKRHHAACYWLTLVGLIAAIASIIAIGGFSSDWKPTAVTELLLVDRLANFYMVLILLSSLACTIFTFHFLRYYTNNKEEVYLLLLIAAAGGLVLATSQHMTTFFIGLELLSVPIYGMVAYTHERSLSLEAGIKYLILSAAASAFNVVSTLVMVVVEKQGDIAILRTFGASTRDIMAIFIVQQFGEHDFHFPLPALLHQQ